MEAPQQHKEYQQPTHSAFYYVPAVPSCKGNRRSLQNVPGVIRMDYPNRLLLQSEHRNKIFPPQLLL